MKVDKKYYEHNTIRRTLLASAKDPANRILSCGFLPKAGNSCTSRNIEFIYYGGLYVISGTGVYVDAETGREYPVYPGCVLQRMPGVKHHTFIDESSDWLEFYFCGGARVFSMLTEMHLATTEPVFYVGESMSIFTRLTEYHALFARTDDYRSTELLMEFQRLLCYLNTCRNTPPPEDRMQEIFEVLRESYRVGVSLEKIAAKCGMSYESLRKQFRLSFGCSLSEYLIGLRINKAKAMLTDKHLSMKEVAAELGYCDTYAFSHQFKQQVGVSPGKYVSEWHNG